jgi:penicillin-binding protein 1C
MRDTWCIGYTDRYTIGVWVGNASGAPMHDVSGISGAAPIWPGLARHLHAGRPSKRPSPPVGVERIAVRFEPAREPARLEWFLAGTGRAVLQSGSPAAAARPFGITSPRDGSLFALDPDIPPQAQKIAFEGERGAWVLDGKPLATTDRLLWSPWPGRPRLTLQGPDGRALQTVVFEVRGASVREPDRAVSRSRRDAPSPRR